MITYEHSFPASLLVLALLLAVPLAGFTAWKFLPRNLGNAVLAVLHLLTLALFAWCLLMPGRKETTTQLLKPRFIIALDTSRSMTLRPEGNLPTRWDAAQQALAQPWTRSISADCQLDVCAIGATLREAVPFSDAQNLKPDDRATLLRDGLRKLAERYSGLDVAGVLLLSDGIDTREAADAWAGDPRPFPVHTLRLEKPGIWSKEPDVRIDSLVTARRVTVGWKSELRVKVSGQGTGNKPVTVQILRNGQPVAEKPARIPDEGGDQTLVFQLQHPEVGTFDFAAKIPALPKESNTDDNQQSTTVQVVDARNRLLYVEGTPRWEYKFLRRVLLADKQVTPAVFYTGPDGKPHGAGGDLTAAMSPSELDKCKIVILGDLSAAELGAARAANLVKFVENGGSLVILGGAKAWGADGLLKTSLAKALPLRGTSTLLPSTAEKDPFPVSLTDTARSHPAFSGDAKLWEVAPPVLSVFAGTRLTPTAQSLVTAKTPDGPQPVVLTQRHGDGKVAVILTDSLWRWQLDPETARNKPYQRFWTQLLSWLLPQEEQLSTNKIDLFADRDQIFIGEEIVLHARIGDAAKRPDALECSISLPDGRTVPYRMNPGTVQTSSGKSYPGFTLRITPEVPGAHKAIATAKSNNITSTSDPVSFNVQPFSPETMPRPVRAGVLKTISATSNGKFFDSPAELDKFLSSLAFHPAEEQSSEFRTLWRNWPVIVALMLALASSWALRKLRNMP